MDWIDLCLDIFVYVFVALMAIGSLIGPIVWTIWIIETTIENYRIQLQKFKESLRKDRKDKKSQRSKLKNSSTCDAGSSSHKE